MVYGMSATTKTHGRCKQCERRTGMPTVYRWKGSAGRRLKDAYCPRCTDGFGVGLHQTTVALLKTVLIVDEDPYFRE